MYNLHMDIFKIKGVVKDYSWGNADFIPSLIGGYDAKPQAELWFGTHKLGPSVTEDGVLLGDLVRSNRSILGDDIISRFGGDVPLLFKVLAISSPLSLQCHPDKKQAEDGWKREEEARQKGLEVNYMDDNEKPEIIAALTPVTAMCGFRSICDISESLSSVIPETYNRILKPFSEDARSLFFRLYALSDDDRNSILEELAGNTSSAACDSGFKSPAAIASECLRLYPGDIGALFPFIMNIINLNPGEALFLGPDILHAYVYGNGVELMAASDNVLRGGLTTKRMDLDELSRIMLFTAGPVGKARMYRDESGLTAYDSPSPAFRLLEGDTGTYRISDHRFMLALVISGSAEFRLGGETLRLSKGECAVVPHSVSDYEIEINGKAFFAEVPHAADQDR